MSPRTAALLIFAVFAAGCSGSDDRSGRESATAAAAAADPASPDPREVLPTGSFAVDVMEIMAPTRANELGMQLQAAVSKDPEWFRAHLAAAAPGEPLAYDARLGLSREEYAEYLRLMKQMTAQRTGSATLAIADRGNDVYVLEGGEDLPDLTGIEIDLEQDVVRTPFGEATERSEIDVDESSPLGAWKGMQWKREDPGSDGVTGTIAKLAIGRVGATGRGVLYYDVKAVRVEGVTRITRILNYDLPTKR